MSQTQLLELEKTLLKTLSLSDLEDFILRLAGKVYRKRKQKKATLPVHIRKEIGQSLAEIKEGKFVDVLPDEEVSILNSIQKMKKLSNVHTS